MGRVTTRKGRRPWFNKHVCLFVCLFVTDEGTCTQNIGEICTQNIGERNGKANEKSEPEERRRDLPEWGETLASETRRTRGLVGSEGPEDPGTEGIREW